MNTFPINDNLPEFNTRKVNTFAWLKESTDIIFSDNGSDLASSSPTPGLNNGIIQAPDFDRSPDTIKPGSVRLLSTFLHTDIHTRYVLVVGEWSPGHPIIVPFSPFESPATQKELLSGLEDKPLQVLQVWNTRSCPSQILTESWYVCHLEQHIVDDVLALYQSACLGMETIPASLLPRIGTSLLSSEDPRQPYLRSQLESFIPLSASSHHWQAATAGIFDSSPDDKTTDHEEDTETVIRFPAVHKIIDTQFSHLAAADDDSTIKCIRITTAFSVILNQMVDEEEIDLATLKNPIDTFSASITTHPERWTSSTKPLQNCKASFTPDNNLPLPHGMPFFLLMIDEGRIGGIGEINLDENLELTSCSDLLLKKNPSNLLLVLPER